MSDSGKKLWEFACLVERHVRERTFPEAQCFGDLSTAWRDNLNACVREIADAAGGGWERQGSIEENIAKMQMGEVSLEDVKAMCVNQYLDIEPDRHGAHQRPGAQAKLKAVQILAGLSRGDKEDESFAGLLEILKKRETKTE